MATSIHPHLASLTFYWTFMVILYGHMSMMKCVIRAVAINFKLHNGTLYFLALKINYDRKCLHFFHFVWQNRNLCRNWYFYCTVTHKMDTSKCT